MLCYVNFSGLVKAKDNNIYKGSVLPLEKIINRSLFVLWHRQQILLPVDFDTTVGETFTTLLSEVSDNNYKAMLIKEFVNLTSYSHALQIYNSLLADLKGNYISLSVDQLSRTIVDYCNYEDKNFTDLHVMVDFVWCIKKTIKTEFTAVMENHNE